MICITSPAGVRMAKAGKALEEAKSDFARCSNDPEHTRIEIQNCSRNLRAAHDEYDDSVRAVMNELYDQRLHEMTGP